MSYTAPQYVDTREQAILALASTIADEDKSALGDGSVNKALDILADVLANQDVQVPQTNAGAILALAQYVSGGGGGDFTTAEVTIVNSHGSAIDGMMPRVFDEGGETHAICAVSVRSGRTDTLTAILYKGHSVLSLYDDVTISIEGSATDIGAGAADVTGDCTITVS